MMRLRPRQLITIGALVALIIGLHALSALGLRGPDGLSRASLDAWVQDPIIALATCLRWLGLLLAYYLAGVVVAVLVFGDRLEQTPLRRVIPPHVAGMVGLALGLSAVALPLGANLVATSADRSPAEDTTATLIDLGSPPMLADVDRQPEALRVAPARAEDAGTRERLDADATDDLATAAETWTVEPGDSFWTIAEEHLADSWDRRDLDDHEIAIYWRTLIEVNTDRLVEPGNPDLLFPGQTLMLPEIRPLPGARS